ncbi:ATP-binding protein [Pararhizobium sp. PWRC1-1]|uniref:ATP-binding protein n=1 Tax=Pararhizobium sp. PWRC1-1 TaxID=2804566 RepID=UPI003CF9DDBD
MFGHIDACDRLLRRHSETLEDTVEQRTAELRLAKEETDSANQAKSTFLATMAIHISPAVPTKVVGDPVRLTQIVSNLVNNGLKFTETGGVTISVDAAPEQPGQFRLVVEDTGVGIAEDNIGRIFTKFSQADASITRKFGCTGLALTGHVMGKDAERWKEAGMDGYLAKPFNIAQLLQVFRNLDVVGATVASDEVVQGSEIVGIAEHPVLSPDTLEMFAALRSSTGTDIRAKVFGLFLGTAFSAYEIAAAEINARSEDDKRLVHALKSNCSSSGAARAIAICQQIEMMLADGRFPEGEVVVERLGEVLKETFGAMAEVECNETQVFATA